MYCPICKKVKLEQTILSGVEVDYCPKCLGLWFEEEELRLAKDYKDRDLRWLDIDLWKDEEKFKISPGQKLCPQDRLPLYEADYADSNIKVDLCNICKGVWLDRGEFKKIIEYLQKRKDYEIFHKFSRKLFYKDINNLYRDHKWKTVSSHLVLTPNYFSQEQTIVP